jgi:D-hexose-6-phosphate mutarotase
MQNLEYLNDNFRAEGAVTYNLTKGRLPLADLVCAKSSAAVCLHGGHIMSFRPAGSREVLWMSGESWYAEDKPIRGGIPVCWPWFGAHPSNPDLPAHGFARVSRWEVVEAEASGHKATRLTLRLVDSPETRAMLDQPFELLLSIAIADELEVALTTRNLGDSPLVVTQALHTYFNVSNVADIVIDGFDGCPFVDTVGGANAPGLQQGPIRIAAETDAVFVNCPGEATIDDPGFGRRIRIAKEGSNSAVVWNPWVAKSARMPDFGDDEYPGMVCVETTNARGDEATIPPGGSHCLKAIISVEPLAN